MPGFANVIVKQNNKIAKNERKVRFQDTIFPLSPDNNFGYTEFDIPIA